MEFLNRNYSLLKMTFFDFLIREAPHERQHTWGLLFDSEQLKGFQRINYSSVLL